jgi:ATP-dependent RNA helicase DDX5/DBP2
MSGYFGSSNENREWKTPAWITQSESSNNYSKSNDQLGSKLNNINWSEQSLVRFNKNFYREHPDVAKRSDTDVKRVREELGITVFANNVPRPVLSFHEANFPDYVLRCLIDADFVRPTSIQSQGIFIVRMATCT